MIQSPAGYQGDVRIKRYLDFYQAGYGVAMLSSGVAFSPLSLFANGEQGGWYDPSDLTTLYQDAAGTTPVTAVEQPVGLVLDKSRGLVLGSELVTNGDFSNGSTGWTLGPGVTISSGAANCTAASRIVGQNMGLAVGKSYKITFDYTRASGSKLRIEDTTSAAIIATSAVLGASGSLSFIIRPGEASITIAADTAVFSGTIDNISVRELPGNHLSQSTAAARPVLSARVNLLTYTEDLGSAYWSTTTGFASRVSSGGFTTLTENTSNSTHTVAVSGVVSVSAYTNFTLSASVKAGTRRYFQLQFDNGSQGVGVVVDTQAWTATPLTGGATITASSITPEDASTYRVSVSGIYTSGTNAVNVAIYGLPNSTQNNVTYQGTGATIVIGKIDLRPANAGVGLPAYQRVGAATSGSSTAAGNADYDTTGFPYYLRPDGTDDWMSSASIDFSSTDKMSVFVGARKLKDTPGAMLVELSSVFGSNAGSFFLTQGDYTTGTGARWQYAQRGTAAGNSDQSAQSPTNFAAPITNVISGYGVIATDTSIVRVNGVQQASATGDQGSGNFGNYPLYVFRRGGSTLPFEGHFYGLVIVGRALTAAEISSMESWMAAKTGVTL